MNHSDRYVAPARWLHWITAGLILVVLVCGIWMKNFEPADEALKFQLYTIHESSGVLVFFLVLARIVVRWRNKPPPLPTGTARLIVVVAGLNHAALYVLMVVQPVIGFLGTNAWGFPLTWFWLVTLPSPIGKNVALAPLFSTLHWFGAMAMLTLLAAHIGGVIYHTFIRRDGLLRRMA